MSPDEMISFMENVVLPSYKMLVEGDRNKKYTGGQIAGQRAWAIIADFPNHEEANKWVTSIPYWAYYTVKIMPIVSFQNQTDAANKMVQDIKSRQKKQ